MKRSNLATKERKATAQDLLKNLNKQNKLAAQDFLEDLGQKPTLEIDEEIENSYLNLLIEKTNNKLKLKLSGKSNNRNIENLEDLADDSSKLGRIAHVEHSTNGNGDYSIILNIIPNEFGVNLIEVLKQKIQQYNSLCKNKENFLNLTKFDKYLGTWIEKEDGFRLRGKVGKDIKEIYACLEEKLGVTMKQINSEFKGRNIAAARTITSLILKSRYNGQLSTVTIGKIIGGKNHSTVITGLKRFKRKKLELYNNNISTAVNNAIRHYTGKINKNYKRK